MDGTKRHALEAQLIRAGHARRLCVIYDDAGRNRIVEPYKIFNARRGGRRLLQCYQVAGSSGTGERAGWKNLDLDHVARIQELDVTFDPRGQYAETAEAGSPPLRLAE